MRRIDASAKGRFKGAGRGGGVSKGYPTRGADDAYPVLDRLLPEDVCMVCKRRPREASSSLCAPCRAALHPERGGTRA